MTASSTGESANSRSPSGGRWLVCAVGDKHGMLLCAGLSGIEGLHHQNRLRRSLSKPPSLHGSGELDFRRIAACPGHGRPTQAVGVSGETKIFWRMPSEYAAIRSSGISLISRRRAASDSTRRVIASAIGRVGEESSKPSPAEDGEAEIGKGPYDGDEHQSGCGHRGHQAWTISLKVS
jgi:hypothetical protein